jgi:histidinol-phosphate/aromatic aminotransferase/cobyric acid decarboxylase-like protein
LEADAYLSSSRHAVELELAKELRSVTEKVKERRAEVLESLDEHGLRSGLTAEERARFALARLPESERLLLAAELVMGCRPGAEGERLASLIRGLVCNSSP